jgi:hypothetical protein
MQVIRILLLVLLLQACSNKQPTQDIVQPSFEQSQNLFDELDKEMEK